MMIGKQMFRGRFAAVVVGVAALVGVGAGGVTASMSFRAPPTGPTIAIVDLEAVINKLNEKTEQFGILAAAHKAKTDELAKLSDRVKAKETEIRAMAEGPSKERAKVEFREMVYRGEFEAQFAGRQLDNQQGDVLRDLYLKIDEAATALAKRNGYHMVIVSDENVDIPKGSSEAVMRGMLLKRFMFVDKTMDITDELVTFMNNAHAAARK